MHLNAGGLLSFNRFMHLFILITRHSKEQHIKEVRKLKENQITLQLINKYLSKLREIKMAQKKLQLKQEENMNPPINPAGTNNQASLLQKRQGPDVDEA